MKPRIAIWIVLLCLLLTACSQQSGPEGSALPSGQVQQKEESYDEADVKTLLNAGIFSEEPEQLDIDIACGLFGLDEGLLHGGEVYLPTSTNGEALALFLLNDAGDAQSVKAACESWLEDQIESYQSYGPEHVPKLEGAVLRVREDSVLLVVGAEPETVRTAVDGLDG